MDRNVIAAITLSAALTAGIESGEEKTTAQLVKQLHSSHYPSRESATRALKARYDDNLEKELLAVKTDDVEAKRRIEYLLEPYYEKQVRVRVEDMIRACKGKLPWIDMQDDSCVQQNYMSQVPGGGPGDNPPEYGKYRRATEALLMDLSKQGYQLSPLVEHMKQRHNNWQIRNNLPPEYDIKK